MEWASAVTILGFICICSSTASAECEPIVRGFTRDTRLEIHTNKIGVSECCEAINCDKGTQACFCEADDPTSTSCVPCEAGKFQPRVTKSSDMVECELHTHCDPDSSEVLTPGTATTDTVCICSLALGYHGVWSVCRKNQGCPAGFQHKLDGSCESCPNNFYQATKSVMPCSPCTVCDPETQKVDAVCLNSSNTVCVNKTFALSPLETHENSSSVIIVVAVFAGVILAAILVVVAVVCGMKWRKEPTSSQPSASTSGSNISQEQELPVNAQEKTPLVELDTHGQQMNRTEFQRMPFNNNNRDETSSLNPPSLCQNDRPSHGRVLDHHQRLTDYADVQSSSTGSDQVHLDLREEDSYIVETDRQPGSVYDQPQHCTRMNGRINASNGNVYVIKHCQNVQVGL